MTKLFLGGIPTAPDVKKLRDAFPKLSDGMDISHEQIQAVIGLAPKSNRYRCVTTAWRKELLNEENVEVGSIAGVGFRVLTGPERLSSNIKGFRSGTRKQGKSVRRITMVRAETLSEPEQAKQLHMMRLGTQLISQASSMLKQLEPPKPAEQVAGLRQPPQTNS